MQTPATCDNPNTSSSPYWCHLALAEMLGIELGDDVLGFTLRVRSDEFPLLTLHYAVQIPGAEPGKTVRKFALLPLSPKEVQADQPPPSSTTSQGGQT